MSAESTSPERQRGGDKPSLAPRAGASRFFPTDTWVRALLAPALVFIACGIDRNYQTDLWHHLARGQVIVEEGRILDEDRFTFTVDGERFQDVNWLSQVFFYRLWQLGGLELLQAVNALLLAGMMALLVGFSYRLSRNMAIAGGVGVFIFVGLWQLFLIRPQTLSLLLFVSLYAVMEGARKRPWLLALAPAHLALWVNMHGAFPIGLVLIGCYGLAAFLEATCQREWQALRDHRVWLLALCLLASILATLLNPYGAGVYQYVRQTSGLAAARRIDEWLPPGLGTLTGKVWAASLVGLVVLLTLPGRRPELRQVVLLAVFLPLSCGSVRMIAWWLLVLAPIAAQLIADRLGPRDAKPQAANLGATLSCLGLLTAMLLSLPWFESWSPFMRFLRSPHRVETDLESTSQQLRAAARSGNIFTRFEWGEYLGWRLAPEFRVFMDGRIEIFPDPVWNAYSAITSGHADWGALLEKWGVRYLVLDAGPYHGQILPLVQARPDVWEPLTATGDVLVFRRRTR